MPVHVWGQKPVQRPGGAHEGVDVIEVKTIGEHELQLIRYAHKVWRIGMSAAAVAELIRKRGEMEEPSSARVE
jgi:hypothetical protein